MCECFYLLVWCEDSDCWWQADVCEERSLGRAIASLRGRNPRQCRPGRPWAVVPHSELQEALTRRPTGLPIEVYDALNELVAV